MDNCPVKKILADSSDEVRLILSDDRTVVTKYLVICAGAWTNRLLDPIGWKLPLQPIKIPVFYYKADGHIPHTFIYEDDDRASHIWGLPELEYPGLVKVSLIIQSTMFPPSNSKIFRFACIPVQILTLNNGTLSTSLPTKRSYENSFLPSFLKLSLFHPLRNHAFTPCHLMVYTFWTSIQGTLTL